MLPITRGSINSEYMGHPLTVPKGVEPIFPLQLGFSPRPMQAEKSVRPLSRITQRERLAGNNRDTALGTPRAYSARVDSALLLFTIRTL